MSSQSAELISAAMERHFSAEALLANFRLRQSRLTPGVDRLSPLAFEKVAAFSLLTVSIKLKEGAFRFSPYLEKLVSKGRNKPPRVIARPTVRDKLALWAIKDVLHEVAPDSVPAALPNQVMRNLVKALSEQPGSSVVRLDIQAFYDQIDRGKLLPLIERLVGGSPLVELILSSIQSPIVPMAHRRAEISKYSTSVGVPQGLPISNFLAHLYLTDIDRKMEKGGSAYFRYVDDILLLVPEAEADQARAELVDMLDGLGLVPNLDKSRNYKFGESFEFLGYEVCGNIVRPKRASIDKYLRSVAGLFCCLREGVLPSGRRLSGLSDADFADLFVLELNELITGAISGGKQYGWVFYFNETNDRQVFAWVDSVIKKLSRRTDLLTNAQRSKIKRCVRASYETRHSRAAGYVKNYDRIESVTDKLRFLRMYSYVDKLEELSVDVINSRYEVVLRSRLSRLERDVGFIS